MKLLRQISAAALGLVSGAAIFFALALHRTAQENVVAGPSRNTLLAIGLILFLASLGCLMAILIWTWRQSTAFGSLEQQIQSILDGRVDGPIASDSFHDEIARIAGRVDDLRTLLLEERQAFATERAATSEIMGGLREGLLAIDRSKKVVFANNSVAELFGLEGPIVGRSFLEVVRQRSLLSAFDRALAGEKSVKRAAMEIGGRERNIEMRVFPLASSSEMRAVALFIDVSELERLERVRRDFLDDFSHEVRTPLAGLRSAIEAFDRGPLSEVDEQQLRKIILRQITKLERLVGDLSELNRIETGDLILERRPTELQSLLIELCDELGEQTSRKRDRIVIRGGQTVAYVDSLRVQQIFSNLIDNALRHGGKTGQVIIETVDHPRMSIVRVTDFGEGIPEGEQQRIFNRFYRMDKSRSQNVPGSGLGLAITKHLILLHGGTISVTSEVGKGTTFEVRLPRGRPESIQHAAV